MFVQPISHYVGNLDIVHLLEQMANVAMMSVLFIVISLSVVFNQILHKVHVIEIDGAGIVLVHCCNLGHVIVGEGKVEDVEVLLHTLLVSGFRDGHDAALREPAEGYLRGGLAVLCTNAGQ